MPLFFPEAAYIESVAIPDGELPEFIGALMNDLETGVLDRAVGSGDREVMRIGEGASVATFDPVSHHSPDQKDLPHA
ncbi:hypothetical protein ACPXCE_11690 [Streptomyces sp. DT24]|uniref:hypothetical protein n=1 Tax=Streptomyces sp. DT24 TaxID=3416520 RepID=UPI003CF8096F